MKKSTIVFISLVSSILTLISCGNEKETNKEVVSKEQSIDNFIPENWILIDTAYGDLNKDNVSDVAIVVRNTDKKNIILNDGDSVNNNPYSLIILFKDQSTNTYKQTIKNDKFIPHDDAIPKHGPFSAITVVNGNLRIELATVFDVGTHYFSSVNYLFRHQDNDFALIGAETSFTNKADGKTEDYSINFLTKKYSITNSNAFDENQKATTEWKTFELDKLKTLSTIDEALTWKFNGTYL